MSINPRVSESEKETVSESEEESSDSEEQVGPPTKRKFIPRQDTIDFLRSVTEKPLKNDRRKMITSKFPLPSCDPAHPPKWMMQLHV